MNKLSPRMVHLIEALATDWRRLDQRIEAVSSAGLRGNLVLVKQPQAIENGLAGARMNRRNPARAYAMSSM